MRVISAKPNNETLLKSVPTLKLYPNPAKDYLMVEYTGLTDNSRIEVIDMLGRTIKIQLANSNDVKIEIDTHALSDGMYFVRIESDGMMKERGKFNILKQ